MSGLFCKERKEGRVRVWGEHWSLDKAKTRGGQQTKGKLL